jgi:predicted transcriptional regulator
VCLNYVWGFKEIEIAALFGITDSRVSQRLSSAVSRVAQRERKRGQSGTISPNEEQARREREASGQVEIVGQEEGLRVSPDTGQEMPEELLGTFGEDTF